jgi:hypothetical protein
MQAPPGRSGPQLSPDGNYWWDGMRWVALNPYQAQWQQPPPFQMPAPSPGLRPFLIVFLIISDVLTGLLAIAGLLALLDYLGVVPSSGPAADAADYSLIGFFFVLFALTLASTIGVVRRSRWARAVTIAAGLALCLTCLGVVLGIPIIVAGARAPMTKTAPS